MTKCALTPHLPKLLAEGWILIAVSVSGVVWQFCLAWPRDDRGPLKLAAETAA